MGHHGDEATGSPGTLGTWPPEGGPPWGQVTMGLRPPGEGPPWGQTGGGHLELGHHGDTATMRLGHPGDTVPPPSGDTCVCVSPPTMLLSLCSLLLAPTRLLLALRRLVARLGVLVAAVAAAVAYGLWGVGVLLRRGPRETFRRRVRDRPPPGLADGTFGEHRYLYLKVLLEAPAPGICPQVPGGGPGSSGLRSFGEATGPGELRAGDAPGGHLPGHRGLGDTPRPRGGDRSHRVLPQLPWLPELLLSLADFELVKTLLRGPWTGTQDPARRLTEQEVDAYIYGLSQPGGLSPPIHYYRNLFRDTPIPREPPPPPTLVLWGTHDAFLDPRLVPCLHRCLRPSARLCLLPGASHWLPEDQPRPIAHLMRDFLGGGDQHP
ncbi:epoxide hydrolase 3 isoform X3 [Athene noctua]|uniref:epoxide hydrolase 3 isoform X3 n=1 Tax=Athene noctua TaxID=126797 RepID=UPI003EBA926C